MNNTKYFELLVADFTQCFNQMRHYDTLFINIVNFLFALITAVVVASIALISKSDVSKNSYLALSFLYALIFLIGLLVLAFLLRNRGYFAYVTKYVNEIRGHYQSYLKPVFENKTGLPITYTKPPLFSPGSTHTIIMYFVALINSVFIALAVSAFDYYNLLQIDQTGSFTFNRAFLLGMIASIIQLLWILFYLIVNDKGPAQLKWWRK